MIKIADQSFTCIPDMLVHEYGNQSAVARTLKVQRQTVAQYAKDYNCVNHIVINGELFTLTRPGNRKFTEETSV